MKGWFHTLNGAFHIVKGRLDTLSVTHYSLKGWFLYINGAFQSLKGWFHTLNGALYMVSLVNW